MCGIVGIRDAGGVSFPIFYALYALQHRGQESAGLTTFDGTTLNTHKGQGLVAEVFNTDLLHGLKGSVGIGHVRYPTTGANRPENIQPFTFRFRDHLVSIAHNGNLVNTSALRAAFEQDGQIFCTSTDTEIIAKVVIGELCRSGSVEDAVNLAMRALRGSYSVILLIDGDLYAFRDPLGIKPLCLGKTPGGYIVASESVAVDALGGTDLRDVRPGELLKITADEVISLQIAVANRCAHCIFEYIYFARADAVMDGALVYDVRVRIGEMLHQEEPIEVDCVCPVPDSGTAYAIGFSRSAGIPFIESLMKNRYMGRTFIMPTQRQRESAVRIKLNPIRDHIKGRSIALIDDSIVRGTTSRRIVEMIRGAGAKEVHLRIGSPPIIAPCYLGVDLPTRDELIASSRCKEEVAKCITATTLHHITLRSLVAAIGIEEGGLCTGCLTGCYPIRIPDEVADQRTVDFVGATFQTSLGFYEES